MKQRTKINFINRIFHGFQLLYRIFSQLSLYFIYLCRIGFHGDNLSVIILPKFHHRIVCIILVSQLFGNRLI